MLTMCSLNSSLQIMGWIVLTIGMSERLKRRWDDYEQAGVVNGPGGDGGDGEYCRGGDGDCFGWAGGAVLDVDEWSVWDGD